LQIWISGYLFPFVPNCHSSSSMRWNYDICSPLTQALTPTYLNPKSNPSIQVCSDSLWERANPIPLLCFWVLGETLATWWIFTPWFLNPRRLEVAWELPIFVWQPQEVCITLVCLVETLHLLPWW
jgi:hypothetical protein